MGSRLVLAACFVWILAAMPGKGLAADRIAPNARSLAQFDAVVLMGQFTTNYYHATQSQAANIELIASRMNGMVVTSGAEFSYNLRLGPYTAERGFGWGRMFVGARIVPSIGGGVCQGSSTLYNAVIRAGLPVTERHKHGLTVPYLPPGQDATVAYGAVDFRFRNDTTGPVVIVAHAGHRHLTVALYGAVEPPDVMWQHTVLARERTPLLIVQNASLRPGERRVLAPGQPGVTVYNRLVVIEGGRRRVVDFGVDAYRASPRVVESGPSRKGSS